MPEPAWLSGPKYKQTFGHIAARVGEQLGLVPDDDQRMLLDGIYGENAPGIPAAFEVAIGAPRQNIKTSTLEIATLTDLFVFEVPKQLWTAHLFKTSHDAFAHMIELVDGNRDFRRRCRPHRTSNGKEAIELRSGQRIEFHARSTGGGRGGTPPHRVVLDEALFLTQLEIGALVPTLATIPGAQIRYAGSAGMVDSAVWRSVRNRGRAGTDPSLFYVEWGAPRKDCQSAVCMHQVGAVGCALDDIELRKTANVAYGRRISAERLAQFRRNMPPEEFMREFLMWWEDPPTGVDSALLAAWEKCGEAGSVIRGRPTALAVDVSPGRMSSSVAIAGRRADGLPQVELLNWLPGTTGLIELLVAKSTKYKLPVLLDPTSEAGSLIGALEKLEVKVVEVGGREMAQACGEFVGAVTDRQLRHLADPVISTALDSAHQKDYGDGAKRWSRTSSAADITSVVAVTLALHGHVTQEPKVPPVPRRIR